VQGFVYQGAEFAPVIDGLVDDNPIVKKEPVIDLEASEG
jgi:hypothetical protein